MKTDGSYALWLKFVRAHDLLVRDREDELSSIGITLTQFRVIQVLKSSKGSMIQADMARALFREPNTISDLLKRMEKLGYIKRYPDMVQKNSVSIELTPLGDEMFEKAQVLKDTENVFSSLGEEKAELLDKILDQLIHGAINDLGNRHRDAFISGIRL